MSAEVEPTVGKLFPTAADGEPGGEEENADVID